MTTLPHPETSPACAAFTKDIGVSPHGTAMNAAIVITVELPLPWPKPVFSHPTLAGLGNSFDTPLGEARVFATASPDHEPLTVTAWWTEAGAPRRALFGPQDQAELQRCFAGFAAASPEQNEFFRAEVAVGLSALVCTQGTHDICCGSEGTRVANELTAANADIEVFRVSHLGGHRFAPTVLTLPSRRMWAYTSADELARIVHQQGDPGLVAPRCRGWLGAEAGPAQVAEIAVFAKQGWDFEAAERTVSAVEGADLLFEVESGVTTWLVEVTATREVPTISCRAQGGLPAKTELEYQAQIVAYY